MTIAYSVLARHLSVALFLGTAGCTTSMLNAQVATRIADINTSLNPIGISSSPTKFISMDTYVLFQATDAAHGSELWRTDGTTAGTQLVKDVYPGPVGSLPSEFCRIGNKVYFVATDSTSQDLWVTDGTTAGTRRVRSVSDAASSAGQVARWWLTNVNGTLFFVPPSADVGLELWKSDGTAAGTVLVKDIVPGPGDSNIKNLCAVGANLYFSASDTGLGNELWMSDGTEGRTVQVKEIQPGDFGGEPSNLFNYKGRIFFAADDGVNGNELWTTDGTTAGTVMVRDIVSGPVSTNPRQFMIFNDDLYFVCDSAVPTWQSIYRLRGSTLTPVAGTDAGLLMNKFSELTPFGSTLYFVANTSAEGEELFRLKAGGVGSEIAANIIPGFSGSVPRYLTVLNNAIYFSANDLATGFELCRFDGVSFSQVRDINAVGGASSYPKELTRLGNNLIFSANNGVDGVELWSSNGTSAGTRMVKDINFSNGDSYPASFTNFNGRLLYSADDGLGQLLTGREPYITDPASGSAVRLRDVNPAEASSMTTSDFFTVAGGKAFFNALTTSNGRELWVTDGTPVGTTLVRDIIPGTSSSVTVAPAYATVGGTLYFPAADTLSGTELWSSDGTSAGTNRVRDVNVGAASGISISATQYPVALGNLVFFAGRTTANGVELWRTDGTSAGTVRLSEIATGAASSDPMHLTPFAGTIFFTASNAALGRELYRVNLATSTVSLIKNINLGSADGVTAASPMPITSGSLMYFVADDGVAGPELWATDGTSAGTRLVLDINPGPAGSRISQMTPGEAGEIYFAADDAVHGLEIWRSDGTPAGTVLLSDLHQGSESSIVPGRWAYFNHSIYFAADDGVSGIELYRTNFFSAPLISMMTDINPGLGSSNISELCVIGDSLFFGATDGVTGQEIYRLRTAGCSAADIADSQGNPGANGQLDGGDFDCFFNFYFETAPLNAVCDIADGVGTPLPPYGNPGFNPGVDGGDFDCFFTYYFEGCL